MAGSVKRPSVAAKRTSRLPTHSAGMSKLLTAVITASLTASLAASASLAAASPATADLDGSTAATAAAPAAPVLHGPTAPGDQFPSHRFTRTPHRSDTQLGFHFGLVQPLVMRGFNAAVELRRGRFIATYSHGQGLEASLAPGVLTSSEKAAGMRLTMPYTTGGGIGVVLIDELYVLADVKLHHFEAYAGSGLASYSTVTVGGEIGWRFYLWKGFHVTPVVRYWPNVWDSAPDGGVTVPTPTGSLTHQPAKQGFGGLFANVLIGWSFELGS